jgi:hypothetical protein
MRARVEAIDATDINHQDFTRRWAVALLESDLIRSLSVENPFGSIGYARLVVLMFDRIEAKVAYLAKILGKLEIYWQVSQAT